jgi:hypothetical protein
MKIFFALILLNIVFVTSCYYDKEEQLYPNSVETNCNIPLTYTNGIKDIIETNCVSCHKPGGNSPDLSTYTLVKENTAKITLRAITQKNMPSPSGMNACNITKLDNWIKAGTPQ